MTVLLEPPNVAPIGWPTMIRPGVPRITKYFAHVPHPAQRVFLMLRCLDAFYGGAAGGAKSDALLMGALQFVDVPGYAALLIRKTYQELVMPNALIDRAHDWLDPTDASWDGASHTWTFPSGATLTFGHLQSKDAAARYQSAEFHYIGIDEVTAMLERQVRFLFGRLRKELNVFASSADGVNLKDVPLRFRSASNPGGPGHTWVKRRYVDDESRAEGRVFIPAKMTDNPSIDPDEYMRSLKEQYPTDYMRMAYGDWDVREPGELMDRAHIAVVDRPFPAHDQFQRPIQRVRYWDMAATEVEAGKDPDWAVGLLLARDKDAGLWRIEHIWRDRLGPSGVESAMQEMALRDGADVDIVVEQEPGSEAKAYQHYLRRHVLPGFTVKPDKVTDPKHIRIRRLEPIVTGRDVSIVNGPWVEAFLDEIDAWPNVEHEDQVDALAGAYAWIAKPKSRVLV